MRRQLRSGFLAACLAGALLPLSSHAVQPTAHDDSGSVQSRWKPQEIRYSYVGYTTAYSCDAIEDRLKDILTVLGAHPQTKVRASGCILNRPSRNFFITITTATPVAVTDGAQSRTSSSKQELIDRLGVKDSSLSEPFPAAWKTVALSRDRKLDMRPGDCELLEGLRDHVLPKLSIKIVEDRVRCVPHTLGIKAPELTVSALVPVPSADQKRPAV